MAETPPIILTVAGFDPSSGAGVTADLKTIAAHDCYGIACITALTVQSTKGVRAVEPVAGELVRKTLEELVSDFEIAAWHIGMLGIGEIVQVVGEFLEEHKPEIVVLDPILRSSSGAELLDTPGVRLLVEKLLPLASVITPNVDEASVLTGLPVEDPGQMRVATERLHSLGAKAVVITGGHLDPAVDLLSYRDGNQCKQEEFRAARQHTRSTHGTGCAFATAVACQLALGKPLREAMPLAKAYVQEAIAQAYPVGKGIGPVNHLYRLDKER